MAARVMGLKYCRRKYARACSHRVLSLAAALFCLTFAACTSPPPPPRPVAPQAAPRTRWTPAPEVRCDFGRKDLQALIEGRPLTVGLILPEVEDVDNHRPPVPSLPALAVPPNRQVQHTLFASTESLWRAANCSTAEDNESPLILARQTASRSGPTSAQTLLDTLEGAKEIIGVAYQDASKELIFLERDNASLPPLEPSDFLVALQSIHNGTDPAVSIDPGPSSDRMEVKYFGRTAATHFGHIMFEADRLLKVLSAGYDNLTCARATSAVSGFETELEMLARRPGRSKYTAWHRLWFVPSVVDVKEANHGRSVAFAAVTMEVKSEMLGDPRGADAVASAARDFSSFLTQHFDELAAERPVLAELRRLGTLVSIAHWIADRRIPVDRSWLTHKIPTYATQDTTRTVTVSWKGQIGDYMVTLGTFGGVDFSTENTYRPDAEHLPDLVATAALARPAAATARWCFSHTDQPLCARAQRIHNPITVSRRSRWVNYPAPDHIPLTAWHWRPIAGGHANSNSSVNVRNPGSRGFLMWLIEDATGQPARTLYVPSGGSASGSLAPGSYTPHLRFDDEPDALYASDGFNLPYSAIMNLTLTTGFGSGLRRIR